MATASSDPAPSPEPAGYRRSTGTPRGEARRRELFELVLDDLSTNGLVDFSLRRAARAAGTTHKVLLYHFESAEDLLAQAIQALRARRIERGLGAVDLLPEGSLADRVRALWPALVAAESQVLDQAIGLVMYDPDRYGDLGRGASAQYLPTLEAMCPAHWTARRRTEVAEMVLGTLRGFLIGRLTSDDDTGIEAGFAALSRALDREEAS